MVKSGEPLYPQSLQKALEKEKLTANCYWLVVGNQTHYTYFTVYREIFAPVLFSPLSLQSSVSESNGVTKTTLYTEYPVILAVLWCFV